MEASLTYAANATFPADEFTAVSFWDQLDVMGLDAYFTLTNQNNPTLAQLTSAWTANANNENLVATIQNFASSRQKSVIFTELGYKSVDGANTRPWDFGLSGAQDLNEQRDCYEAAFAVWSQRTAFMKGILWWAWPVPAPASNDTDYNPRGKPAGTVLTSWQGPAGHRCQFHAGREPGERVGDARGDSCYHYQHHPDQLHWERDVECERPAHGSDGGFQSGLDHGQQQHCNFHCIEHRYAWISNGDSYREQRYTDAADHDDRFDGERAPDSELHAGGESGERVGDAGATATSAISITRTNFTGSVTLSASGLPTGVTAAFSPASTTGNTSTLTFTASSTATLGPATVTVTGTSTLTPRATTITLTVNAPQAQNYTLAATPASVSVARGAAVTSVINITRTNFTASVTLSASGLPAGVTAAFSPASTTGNTSTLTLTASSTATLGAATVTVTGTSGTLTPRTTTISLNVTGTTGGTGGVTVTPVVNANSPWFNEEFIRLSNTASLTALSVTIVIQRTPTGVSFSNLYNTVGWTDPTEQQQHDRGDHLPVQPWRWSDAWSQEGLDVRGAGER